MKTMTYLHQQLSGANMARLKLVSAVSDVPFRTIYKIARGQTTDPRVSTADAIKDALDLIAAGRPHNDGTEMSRPKTEYRNEMKTRVPDRVYAGVAEYMAGHIGTGESNE